MRNIKYRKVNAAILTSGTVEENLSEEDGTAEVALVMSSVSMPLHKSKTLHKVLEEASSLAKWLLRCDHATVILRSHGSLTRISGEPIQVASGTGIIHQVALSGEILLCNQVSSDPLFNPLVDRL